MTRTNTIDPRIIDAAEELGWTVHEYSDGTVEFSQYSPAGEDFSFTVDAANVADEISNYYLDFDPEEHVTMWLNAKQGGVSGVPSVYELVHDADEIESMLEDLAIRIKEVRA